ncbi:hypothetical protein Tco_0174272 [Tanacetum coccineum]
MRSFLQQNGIVWIGLPRMTDRFEVLENELALTRRLYSFSLETKLILRVKKLGMEYDFDVSTKLKDLLLPIVPVTTTSGDS